MRKRRCFSNHLLLPKKIRAASASAALGLLLGSALAVQYKQDRIFRASVNLQLVMVLNYLYAAYNLLTALQSGSMWLLSLGVYTLMLAIVRTDLTLNAAG